MKAKNIKQLIKPLHIQVRVMTVGKKRKEKNLRKLDSTSGGTIFTFEQSIAIELFNFEKSSQVNIERGELPNTLPQLKRETNFNNTTDRSGIHVNDDRLI